MYYHLLPLLGGIISGNMLVQPFPQVMDGARGHGIKDAVGTITSIAAAATTTDVAAFFTAPTSVMFAMGSSNPGGVSLITTFSFSSTLVSAAPVAGLSSTLISAAPVAASTVLGDHAKEADLCRQECAYAFSSCTSVTGTATTSRGARSMDCGALGNCYCFVTPFMAGSTSIDRDLATHLCASVSFLIPCWVDEQANIFISTDVPKG